MKLNFTFSKFIIGHLILATFLLPLRSFAQPDYDFRDPVLLSGTDRQVGAVYLFANVKPGFDARLTITAITPGITVTELDGASGYPEALQPTLIADPFTSGYLEMYIEFLFAGTSTPAVQLEVPVTCIDVDGWNDNDGLGNPLHEFDQVDLSGGYTDYQLTGGEVSVIQSGTWFNGVNTGGIDYPGRDTAARQAMFTVVNGHISSCTIRVGVNNFSSTPGNRLRSVYWKKFTYPNSLLSKSDLLSFSGVEKNKIVELHWKIEKENNLKTVVIEKGTGSAMFTPIGEINVNGQPSFSFRDDNTFNGSLYYRLKLISVNGKVKYSNILLFHSTGNPGKEFKIYPAIVQSSATIQVNAETDAPAIFQLVDYSGRIIMQKILIVNEGVNNIVVNDLGRVHPGNYVALIKLDRKIFNQKIFKQ